MTYPLIDRDVAGRRVRVMSTERTDGDFHPERVGLADLRSRQRALTGRAWWMTDQVHGVDCFEIEGAGGMPDPLCAMSAVADVLSTTLHDTDLAIWTADCAPIVLVGEDRVVAAHAGWRGLADGVIDAAVDAVRASGGSVVEAVVGPVIHSCCYEFATEDLESVAAGVRAPVDVVSGLTRTGALALDVPAAVRAGLAVHDIELGLVGPCTGCDDRWYSHRVRRDTERFATVVSVEAAA